MPSLWWVGVSQAVAQGIAWHVATVALVILAQHIGRERAWASRPLTALMAGAFISALCHWPQVGYPALVLHTLIAWATVWALVRLCEAEWIESSLVWLALLNVGYAASQWLGYDPLFETAQRTGFMGRSNTLALVCLVAVPLARGWAKVVLIGALLTLGNWTAYLGVAWLWMASLTWRDRAVWGSAAAGLGGLWWLRHQDVLWMSKVLPRLLTWQETLGQALWSPLAGYGLGARSAMSHVGWSGDVSYSAWLSAFHAGGVLLVVPMGWMVYEVGRSHSRPVRTSLLLLAAAGCLQAMWSFGMVVVTLALVAAWIGREHASG